MVATNYAGIIDVCILGWVWVWVACVCSSDFLWYCCVMLYYSYIYLLTICYCILLYINNIRNTKYSLLLVIIINHQKYSRFSLHLPPTPHCLWETLKERIKSITYPAHSLLPLFHFDIHPLAPRMLLGFYEFLLPCYPWWFSSSLEP